jgi:hypothetical protein
MQKAMYESTVRKQSDAHAGADRHVGEVLERLRRAPAAFGECRSVHIGVESDGHFDKIISYIRYLK